MMAKPCAVDFFFCKSNQPYTVCNFSNGLPSRCAVPQKRLATTAINQKDKKTHLDLNNFYYQTGIKCLPHLHKGSNSF